jgi:hypothetical protein
MVELEERGGEVGVVLIRTFSDTYNIGYYSILRDDCITLLPIVERYDLSSIPVFMDPSKIIDKCTNAPLSIYYKFSRFKARAIHNDPRPDLGFYTEEDRPSRIPKRKLRRGDIVLFMAGLARYPDEIWYLDQVNMRRLLYDLKKAEKIGIYIVGGIIVDKIIEIGGDWNEYIIKYPVLSYSPHYYRLERRETVAVLGRGFTVNPPVRIASITLEGYRLSRGLIHLIGYRDSEKLARQNFRKSRYKVVDERVLEKIILSYADKY